MSLQVTFTLLCLILHCDSQKVIYLLVTPYGGFKM